MIWLIYFSAALGLSYIMGHARISLGLRILIGGQGAVDAYVHPMTRQAIPARNGADPLIPVVGPWIVELLECAACSGFWIGVAGSFWLPVLLGNNPVAWAIVMGCATCGMNYFIMGLAIRGFSHD